MMLKILARLTAIIGLNLFAFFTFGHILDTIFLKKGTYTITFVLLSLLPLSIILFFYLKSVLRQLDMIDSKK